MYTFQTEHVSRRRIALMACLLLLVVAIPTVQPTSEAIAAESACAVWGTTPYKYLSEARGYGYIDCEDENRNAIFIEAQMQEKVVVVWYNRGYKDTKSGNSPLLSVRDEYSCYQHGTDYWRTRAKGIDNLGLSKQRHSAQKSISC